MIAALALTSPAMTVLLQRGPLALFVLAWMLLVVVLITMPAEGERW